MLKDPETLLKWIDKGLMFPGNLEFTQTETDIGNSMTKFLYASALPAIWSASGSGMFCTGVAA